MSYSHPRKVTSTSSKAIVSKDTFNLFTSQTSSQDSVNTMTIQCVTDDKVAMRMVTNTSTFFMRDIGLKTLGLEIKKDVSIPRIRRVDEEQSFSKERIYGLSIFISMGRSQIRSANTKYVLALNLENLRSNP
jgi:hypothetical protein